MKEGIDQKTSIKPTQWIQKLKDESWQAELLVSTIAIFGSIQLFKVIDWLTIIAIDRLAPTQYLIGYAIVFAGLLAVSILSTMFIIHFLLRAYWIGLVGLNSVFPDYSLNDSAYSELYTSKILTFLPKLPKTIQDVDELSSVIFSAAFYMLLIYSYLSIAISLLLFIYNYFESSLGEYSRIIVAPFLIILTLQVLISIVANLNYFKKNHTIQEAYFFSTKYSSWLLFGPLYKYLMQISMIFATNFKRKKSLVGLTIVFLCIGMILTFIRFIDSQIPYLVNQESFFNSTQAYHGYYESEEKEGTFLLSPQIDSDIIESNNLKLFIPIYTYEKSLYSNICGTMNEGLTKEEQRKWYLECYSSYNQVLLNDKEIETNFMKYEKSQTKQFGLLAYIDIENATKGMNSLKVVKEFDTKIEWEIPFYYAGK